MVTTVDEILDALKTTVEEIEFSPQPEVFVDEPVNGIKPFSVILILDSMERVAATVAETELGSYDWTLTIDAQVFVELTKRSIDAQTIARRYVEQLVRAVDLDENVRLLIEDDPKVTRAERVGPANDIADQARVFECWTASIEIPALISY